jgi:asparagine synthase (glutamine-hydrolysing)
MCGIAGIIDLDRKAIEPGLLLAMNQAIAHRGPDDEGYVLIDQAASRLRHYAGPTSPEEIRIRFPVLRPGPPAEGFNIALGHRRFSIIDLSSAGHQPFFDPAQECCVVFNGEIYNYVEVRDELVAKGFTFRTQSDTEVLLAAYKCWGLDCFEKLNGFWAVALYDSKKQALVLSRDRIGKKPLYWTKVGSRVYFASEIKALLQVPEIYERRRVNEAAASDWLVYDTKDLDCSTCFDGIYSLASGSWSLVDASFPNHSKRFWKVPEERLAERDISVQEACGRLRQVCEDAVRIRLRCDVPLSVELSGGLDSSVVLALAAQIYPGQITTYTIRFPDEQYNEEPFARSVAQRYGVDYRVLDSPTENFWCQILPFTYLQEEPYHSPNMHTSQVIWSLMRASGTKVLLSGSGGDENFAGYGIYFDSHHRDNLMQGRVDRYLINAWLNSEAQSKFASLSAPLIQLSKEAIKQYAPRELVNRFRTEGWPFYFTGKRYPRSLYPMSASEALYGYMTNLLMPYWLRSGDKVVMGMPIEPRCPLLDYRIIELAFRLPVTYLIRNGWRKWILRKAMEDLLPEDVVWRKKKMGFPFPYGSFREENDAIMETVLDRASNPFIDLSQKQSLKQSWKAMSFVLWYELFFNDNTDLLLDLQTVALRTRPASDYGFTPEYLRNGHLGIGRDQCTAHSKAPTQST